MGKKIAVVTDSNSGITQSQAKEMGLYVLPMPFMINEETFFEDITLTQEQFYERLAENADVITSQPSPEAVMNLWDELLETYDEIVHIPMSSGLSGSCQSARMLSENYDGRVQVVNNQRISVTQRQSALDALVLIERGMDAAAVREFLEEDKFNSSIYIMLDTLYYLKKRRQNHACGGCARHNFKAEARSADSGGEAGCFCQGKNGHTGKDYYDKRHQGGHGKTVRRRVGGSHLAADRLHL